MTKDDTVNHRFQIVFRRSSDQTGAPPAVSRLERLKVILGGIVFAALAVGILVFALFLGSIIFALLWIGIVIVSVALILKAALRQARQ